MWYLSIILIVIIGLLFTPKLLAQSNKGTEKRKTVPANGTVAIQTDTIQPLFSKTQIEEKLKRLAETPPPTNLSWGAMCYRSVSYFDAAVSYICPICGAKTLYGRPFLDIGEKKFTPDYSTGELKPVIFEERSYDSYGKANINACRREIQKIKGIKVALDESEFCKHCSPYTTNPILYLLVNIGGESKTVKIPNVSWTDIRLIQEFLSGSLVHKGGNESETPLINYIARIKELLGVKEEEGGNND